MEPILPDQEKVTVVVGPADQPGRLAQAVHSNGSRNTQLAQYDNVYEALAAVLDARDNGKTVCVYVIVDTLSTDQMQIFSSLDRLSNVRSVAVSNLAHSRKIITAQALGADEVIMWPELTRQNDRSSVPLDADATEPSSNGRPQVTAQPNHLPDSAPPDDEDRAQADRPKTEAPARKDPPVHPPEARPLLSKEELDALLG